MLSFVKRVYFDDSEYLKYISCLTRDSENDTILSYSHADDHFNLITSGGITVTVGGETHRLYAGSMVFFPKDLKYTAEIPRSYSQISVELSGTHRDVWNKYFPLPLPKKFEIRHIPHVSDENYSEFVENMIYDGEIEKARAKNTADRYILAFLACTGQNEHGFKEKFGKLILENDPCRLTLTQISEELHYSKTHTERLMRETFGCSVTEYLHKARLAAATDLLLSTDLPISKIAEQTGFYDASHFSTVFKRETGISPRAYRKKT